MGRLILRYLVKHPQFRELKIAIGARSKSKLDDLAEKLHVPESEVRRVVVEQVTGTISASLGVRLSRGGGNRSLW